MNGLRWEVKGCAGKEWELQTGSFNDILENDDKRWSPVHRHKGGLNTDRNSDCRTILGLCEILFRGVVGGRWWKRATYCQIASSNDFAVVLVVCCWFAYGNGRTTRRPNAANVAPNSRYSRYGHDGCAIYGLVFQKGTNLLIGAILATGNFTPLPTLYYYYYYYFENKKSDFRGKGGRLW